MTRNEIIIRTCNYANITAQPYMINQNILDEIQSADYDDQEMLWEDYIHREHAGLLKILGITKIWKNSSFNSLFETTLELLRECNYNEIIILHFRSSFSAGDPIQSFKDIDLNKFQDYLFKFWWHTSEGDGLPKHFDLDFLPIVFDPVDQSLWNQNALTVLDRIK